MNRSSPLLVFPTGLSSSCADGIRSIPHGRRLGPLERFASVGRPENQLRSDDRTSASDQKQAAGRSAAVNANSQLQLPPTKYSAAVRSGVLR